MKEDPDECSCGRLRRVAAGTDPGGAAREPAPSLSASRSVKGFRRRLGKVHQLRGVNGGAGAYTMIPSAISSGWEPLARAVLVGVLSYVAIVVIIRLSGKRTLASMNAFDFIVTVALGSTLATMLLSRTVSLAEGVAGFLVLIGLQFLVSSAATRSSTAQRIVKNSPRLLYYRDTLFQDALGQERVSCEDVKQALRLNGIGSFDDVEGVVLETNGSISTIRTVTVGERSTLAGVAGMEQVR